MNDSEYYMLVRRINELDLESGQVMKINGQWYINGKRSKVPKPIINLPYWTEGTKCVVIENQA